MTSSDDGLLPPEVQEALADLSVPLLRQIVCPEVWSSLFTADEREQLAAYLPLTPAATADVHMIGRLARRAGESFHFVHPFEHCVSLFRAGSLSADGARHRADALRAEQEVHGSSVRAYHDGMVESLLQLPTRWLPTARRPMVQLLASAQQAKPPPAKRARKTATGGGGSGSGGATSALGAAALAAAMQPQAYGQYGSALAGSGHISLQPVALPAPHPAFAGVEPVGMATGVARGPEGEGEDVSTPSRPPSRLGQPGTPTAAAGGAEGFAAAMPSPSTPAMPAPSSFLALVREVICHAPGRIAPTEFLCRQVAKRMEALGAEVARSWLPAEVTVRDFLLSALKFLLVPPPSDPAYGGVELPSSPLLAFDPSTQAYTWLGLRPAGAGAPGGEEEAEEEEAEELAVLDGLDELHAALHGQQLSNGAAYSTHRFGAAGSQPPAGFLLRGANRSGATVVRTSAAAAERYREQELQRYAQPDKPFRFEFTARDSTGAERTFTTAVAPIKRGAPNPSTKPREHALLKSERPAHVTILTLVRDAAARLPDGVGTRADVSELLRDSQFVVEGASESQLSQVVSGALDRLHYEKDACVKYEPERKLWIYLHRHRTLSEFGQPQASSSRKKPAPGGPGVPPAPGAGPRPPVQPLPPGAAPPQGVAAPAGVVRALVPRPAPT